ncbi:MAG TPA: DNA ligase D [Solirubrobacteraceae bacterium]|nr:DNA ligase D [Solirubrobacteraceae bacterium]
MPQDKLDSYRRKRDLTATPEPAPLGVGLTANAPAAPRFVVQEHHATRLHWDLRLERDGVLVSWAVPNGIPPERSENRLAVHTEDHPLEYLDFHGEIPKGSYGAGTMTIWDTGTYETHKWEEKKVEVTFHGERLRGRYGLFPIGRTAGSENDWMIHRMDPPSDPNRRPMPERLLPMLARAARIGELPQPADEWAYEVKWDGVRTIAYAKPGRLRLESRNQRDVTDSYPELRGLLEDLGMREAVLDGEIVAFGPDGRPSFGLLQKRMHVSSPSAVRRLAASTPVVYAIFDLLYLDGESLLELPYDERRERLEALALQGPAWRVPAVFDPTRPPGERLLEATRAQGLEGIVAKRLDSRYEPGRRNGAWLKIKHTLRQELVIAGWLPGEGRRRERIGALLMGYHNERGALLYAGRVGTGFTERTLEQLASALAPLRRDESPFEVTPKLPREAVFVAPELVAEVEFTEWTADGVMRAPSFKGLRDDKTAAEVTGEGMPPRPAAPARSPAARAPASDDLFDEVERLPGGELAVVTDGRRLKLSNWDKVLFPETGFTKGDLIVYYGRVAPAVLPHLRDRALTLKRYPNGVQAPYFYEKQSPSHRPDWVATETIGDIRYTLCQDRATLLWLANLADLELHTSLALARAPERPTMLAFDLDPGEGAGLVECCEVALVLRGLFDQLGLQTRAKTSGSKGMQVYVPLNDEADYAVTKPFARTIAELLEQRLPKLVVSRMTKRLRPERVLVDWSQNDEHKTTVTVYSVRARERPTVSTPLTWDEVARCHADRDPALLQFETEAVLDRVAEHGDLFADVVTLEQRLPALG